MKQLLKKLLKSMAYVGAALVIVLALAVGIFRLMLPRLPEYQEEIKGWASAAIGMEVEFSGMNARWRLSGPELNFFDAELARPGAARALVTAEEVSIGVGLLRLLADRELVVDRILIRETSLDLRQDEDGQWRLQDTPLDALGGRSMASRDGGEFQIVGEDIQVSFEHPGSGQVLPITVDSMTVTRTDGQVEISASVELPEEFGETLEITADQAPGPPAGWRLFVEGQGLGLAGWSRLQPQGLPDIESGIADLSLWLDFADNTLQRASANVVVDDLRARGSAVRSPFGLQGSIEYSRELSGFLLAANQFRMTTVDGDWPRSSLLVRVMNDEDGAVDGLRASASYLNLNDLKYLSVWIPDAQRSVLDEIGPSGILSGLSLDLNDLQSESPDFDFTSELESAGFAAANGRPGVREFSGSVRADRDGGRIEIQSTDLRIDTGDLLSEAVSLDDAMGTVIWRRNSSGIIVLSDSIEMRNADFDTRSSLQISLPANGNAPFVDVESDWRINDVSAIRRYLPVSLLERPIGQWLQMAPVAGIVRRGSLRMNGSLEDFPFDNGKGSLRATANFQDLVLRYSDKWPAPEFSYVDIELDNMRLTTSRNLANVLGTSVENAELVIPDLRAPVVQIDAFATGTLESLRLYGAMSPINEVLGGQLDRVAVGGEAAVDLTVSYPVQDKQNYQYQARIRSSNGSVRIDGFPAPITELNGIVAVERDSMSTESLFGRFLGNPVDLELARIADPAAAHSVVLQARGSTTASAMVDQLGIPLNDVGSGRMEYRANVRFPNAQADEPGIMQVHVESDLRGFAFAMPAPLAKDASEVLPLAMSIEFPADNQIDSAGSLGDEFRWTSRFRKIRDNWDFDRAALAVGGDYPATPEVRGLHITGQTPELRVHEWLALARNDGRRPGLGDRVRSIDIMVDRLYVVGQRFDGHRIELNRGGADWAIRLHGEQADGLVTVPYNFTGDRPLVVEMDHLYLPGNDEPLDEDEQTTDPRSLPEIRIRAQEFSLGDRYFGQLVMDLLRTENGLESFNLQSADDSFSFVGSAGWIVDIYEESGQRTYLNAKLLSNDIAETARRLAYQPGIIGDDLEVDVEVSWAGAPRQDFMETLNGTVQARLGSGQLEDVEPGAGRVFGLMSIVALPRRLSLDFRDVFDSGFSFDQITGRFRLVNGDAYTCDLTLTSPAADVGIVGRAGLVDRDYSQTAVVSANFGNTLPVAGYVVAGPQVAAALLIFSQIFKKPLQEMSQVYYGIDGSWDDPVIDATDEENFARNSSLAGCIDPTE